MLAEKLGAFIRDLGIETVSGIPDSTLQAFCAFLDGEGKRLFPRHIVPENEGSAVGIAIGEYLASGLPACVYMQNSGLGNAVNPVTSLANREVYGIPMLLLIGWRGEPGVKDEPQHKFMGAVTGDLLEVLDIPYFILDAATTEEQLAAQRDAVREAFAAKRQYAILVRRGALSGPGKAGCRNQNSLVREEAVERIVRWLRPEDVVISTTGKISRELYENMDRLLGSHEQAFLCVGGMGHANMIAYQMARRLPDRRVICLDGDGALLMHMGSLAVLGSHPADNLIHICLDNEAHESVGGMATGAAGAPYERIAAACGYPNACCAATGPELDAALRTAAERRNMSFIRVRVGNSSRSDLVRPKEPAEENKDRFMRYHASPQR